MNRILLAFAATALLSVACAANTSGDGASSAPVESPLDKVTCVTSLHSNTVCSALDPSDLTSASCDDNTTRSDCVDDSDSDYGGGCYFSHRWTRWVVATDCDTYRAQNPDLFK